MLGALAAPAQERAGFAETVGVELVTVDVLALGRGGEPVTDLTVDDFRLFDEGREVAIAHFSRPAGGLQPAHEEGRDSPTPATSELLVVFVDQLHLMPLGRQRALGQLEAVLSRSPARVEVLLASFDGVVEVTQSPTRDRKKLRRALQELIVFGSQSLLASREGRQILHTIDLALEVEVDQLLGVGVPRDQVMDLACSSIAALARNHGERERGRVEATALALQEFLSSLSAYSGRKTMLHVSDGLPLVAGQEAMEHLISLCDGSAVGQGLRPGSPLACCTPARYFPSAAKLEVQGLSTARVWGRVAAEANAHRVSLYTLQASGLAAPGASDVDSARTTGTTEMIGRINDQDPLFLLADETGGRASFNTNDFEGDLERMLEDRGLRYEIGFYPEAADSTVHALRLEVARPGVRVRYRKSYASLTASELSGAGVLAALYHGRLANPHDLRLLAEPRERSGKRIVEVDAELRVPFAKLALLPDEDSQRGLVTVLASARNEQGATLPVGEKAIPLRIAPGDGGKQFRYVLRIPLPRGHVWEVAVALRDELSGKTSIVTQQVELTGR